jgi:hypothetical protein
MPSQFQQAFASYITGNTKNFNEKYGVTSQAQTLPSVYIPRSYSQKSLAQAALSSSPKEFNEQFAYSPKGGRKTRKQRKSKKSRRGKSRRRR